MLNQLFINGTWQPPLVGKEIDVFNPYTEKVIHRAASAGDADVDKAVTAARQALPAWKKAGGKIRGRFLSAIARRLRECSEDLARLSSINNGKPLTEARADMTDAADCFSYYAEQAMALEDRQDSEVAIPDAAYHSHVRFEPVGVAALIVPWNFPMVTTSWKMAPALAAGCTVVLKPSEITPIVELELGRIASEVDLPPGVINIVTGLGHIVGAAMSSHPGVDKVSFTGSNSIGSRVMAAAAIGPKAISLELGGKSPIIVFGSSDVDLAVDLIMGGIFTNAGQMCSATSRLILEKSIAKHVLDRLAEAVCGLKLGDPLDPATTMGPLTTKAQYEKVKRYTNTGMADGLCKLNGVAKADELSCGWFISPTIFLDVPTESPLWREEIFGPILCVRTFESEEEAVALANDTEFGLVATIVSGDTKQARRVAEAVEAGHIWINSPQKIFVETSWGGFKASGIGRELGPWGLSAYLEVKHKTELRLRGDVTGRIET